MQSESLHTAELHARTMEIWLASLWRKNDWISLITQCLSENVKIAYFERFFGSLQKSLWWWAKLYSTVIFSYHNDECASLLSGVVGNSSHQLNLALNNAVFQNYGRRRKQRPWWKVLRLISHCASRMHCYRSFSSAQKHFCRSRIFMASSRMTLIYHGSFSFCQAEQSSN